MELIDYVATRGLEVVNGAVLLTIGGTYVVSGTAGDTAHLAPALAGLIVVNPMLIGATRLVAQRRSEARPT